MNKLNKQFVEQYFSLINQSHDMKIRNPKMSYISVSTITMICDLDCEINTQALSANFQSPEFPICILKKTKAHNEYEITKRGKTIKSFYNQITINYIDHSTKSIKVFSNGRLQMTGLSSVNDANSAVNTLIKILHLSQNAIISTKVSIKDIYIAMINSNFSFNFGIDILKLKLHLEKKYKDFQIIYNPDVYPGLKIKHKTEFGTSSIFVFSTGNVVITGVKSLIEIEKSFVCISETINNNISEYKTLLKPPIKQVKKSNIFKDGYPIQLFNICKS